MRAFFSTLFSQLEYPGFRIWGGLKPQPSNLALQRQTLNPEPILVEDANFGVDSTVGGSLIILNKLASDLWGHQGS